MNLLQNLRQLWSDEIKQRLEKLSNCILDGSAVSINSAAAELTDILISAAEKSLKKPKIGKKKKATKNWYNKDLSLHRKNLMKYGKVYFKYLKDPQVKNHYYKLFREYNKLKKLRYREYKQSLLDKIEALHEDNPKMYWRLIDELRGKEISQNSSAVEPSDWLSYFQNLMTLNHSFWIE